MSHDVISPVDESVVATVSETTLEAANEAVVLSVNSHASVRYWTPFGGFKRSGLGRELGPDALGGFSEVKSVFIATGG